jgi:hypothetical protein
MDNWDRKAKTRQLRQESWDRAAGTGKRGQDGQDMTEWRGQLLGQDKGDKTQRGQDNKHRTVGGVKFKQNHYKQSPMIC